MVLVLEIYWLSLQWHSSKGFEGSVNPSQRSDMKNSLYVKQSDWNIYPGFY